MPAAPEMVAALQLQPHPERRLAPRDLAGRRSARRRPRRGHRHPLLLAAGQRSHWRRVNADELTSPADAPP